MDTRSPHVILPEKTVRALPPEVRRHFVPVPARAEKALQLATPEERAAWLAAHPADALRLERAQEKRARRGAARAARAGSSPA